MAPPLRRGANVALTREVPGLAGVVLGVRWDAGTDPALGRNLVAAAMLCGADGKVLSEQHFVFFNQLASPDASVAQLEEWAGEDDEQIEVDLHAVPPAVDRVVVVIYINEGSTAKRTLGQLKSCRVRVLNLDGNAELVRSEELATNLSAETAVVLGELYRHDGGWKFRVIGQGYSGGVGDVAQTYGIVL
ncbi:MAG: TerD family protein [Acidimicrobiia bacterium]